MASSSSSLALKRLLSSNFLRLRQLAPPASSRLFNTNALHDFSSDDDDRSTDIDHRINRPLSRRDLFSDVLGPFGPRSLSQILNMMDQYVDSPIGSRRSCYAKETQNGLYLKMDMPGLSKENVKISVEQNTLVIKGERPKEFDEDEESGRKYSSRIDLPEKMYKLNEIKAEMKNGILKIVVPKVKEEERANVFHVKVE